MDKGFDYRYWSRRRKEWLNSECVHRSIGLLIDIWQLLLYIKKLWLKL